MSYTIGEVAKLTGLSISTLRYYEKEGLLLGVKRHSGIREFEDKDLNALSLIECLKTSGLQLDEIKEYMDLAKEGDSSLSLRQQIILKSERRLLTQMDALKHSLDMISYKKWYYSTAIMAGSENAVRAITLEEMPANIASLYRKTHSYTNKEEN